MDDEIKLDNINFSFEYDKFIKILKNFHLKKFNKEVNLTPQLSGNKLDLLKFYKRVIKLGGFDHINNQKLWAQLAEPLNLPKTCTSRSYMLKQAYIKTLKDFEFEFKGKIPNLSELDNIKSDVPLTARPIHQDISRNHHHQTPGDSYSQLNNIQPHPIPNNASGSVAAIGQARNLAPIPPGTQPIQHQPLLIRIYYSLKSGLKNEQEWGLIQLLKFSYYTNLSLLNSIGIIKLILDLIIDNLVNITSKCINTEEVQNEFNEPFAESNETGLNLGKLDTNEEEELLVYWLLIRNLLENQQLAEYLSERLVFKDCLYYTLYYSFNSRDSPHTQELKLNTLDCLLELSSYIELEEEIILNILNRIISIKFDRNLILKSIKIFNNFLKFNYNSSNNTNINNSNINNNVNLSFIENNLDIDILLQYSWLFETDKNLGLTSIDLILNYFKAFPQSLTENNNHYSLQLSQLAYRLLDTHIFVQSDVAGGGLAIDTDSIIIGWELIEFFLDNQELLINLSSLKSKLIVKSLLQLSIIPTNIQFKFLNYINKI